MAKKSVLCSNKNCEIAKFFAIFYNCKILKKKLAAAKA